MVALLQIVGQLALGLAMKFANEQVAKALIVWVAEKAVASTANTLDDELLTKVKEVLDAPAAPQK